MLARRAGGAKHPFHHRGDTRFRGFDTRFAKLGCGICRASAVKRGPRWGPQGRWQQFWGQAAFLRDRRASKAPNPASNSGRPAGSGTAVTKFSPVTFNAASLR
jgi:hypothetical protein